MKFIKNIIRNILNWFGLGGIAQIYADSALTTQGWFRSFKTKQSVDANGQPLPWCTYPFIDFIENRLNKQMNVFEYGSGNSTRWYAARVGNIKAVENDKSWFEFVKNQLPANASIVYQSVEDIESYTGEVSKSGQKYNIVIVDGRQRVRCVEQAIPNLATDGIIVFDNPERPNYKPAHDLLQQKGFRRIDFWGFAPIAAHRNCTAIFYKDGNCLGI
jgi:hypothetical protein